MSFIQSLTEFLESIFKASSPEVKKRQELRKIENDLKNHQPSIFKNEFLLPNFAELFRILYENTKPIDDILSVTIASSDVNQNGRFEYQLILTGFTDETQKKLEKLDYQNRKKDVEEGNNISLTFETQRRNFDALLKQLNTPEFRKIDETMAKVQQLSDICHYNYISVIHAFDSNFDGISSTNFSNVKNVRPEAVSSYLQDLYYLTANLSLNNAVVRAVLALHQLKLGRELSSSESVAITTNIKKINTILTKILDSETLRKIICLGTKNAELKPKVASYTTNSIKKFFEFIQGRYNSDEERIKTEIRDYTISFELKELFGEDMALLNLRTYNSDTNENIRRHSPYSLSWITPLQTIKTFLNIYFSETIQSVLKSIVVEGFFNNPSYKTDFSSAFYACEDIAKRLADFEKSFERGEKNDEANIVGLIEDSKRDSTFLKQLGTLIEGINNQAHAFIQTESRNIYGLYKQIGELIVDSKKSKPALVSNIKVLMSSTRNRDGSGILEQQYNAWKVFLKVMKNYAIIGDLDGDDN